MPTETKVWKAIGGSGSGGSSKSKDTTTINIDSLQLKIVNVGNDDEYDSSSDSDDELGVLIYNSSNTAKKCREEAVKEDTVSIATQAEVEVCGGDRERTHDVSTSKPDTVTMTSNVMDSLLNDNTSIATNKPQNYANNKNDIDSTQVVQKKKQRYANEEIVKRLLAERELKRISDMKKNKQMRSISTKDAVGVEMKSSSRGSHVANGDNKEDTNKNVHEKKKDTDDQSPTPLVDQEDKKSSTISEYVTAMNSIESMLSNRIKKEKERSVGGSSQEQGKKEDVRSESEKKDVPKSVSESLPSAPPRDFDWVSHYRQHHNKNTTLPADTAAAKKQKKTAKEPPVIVTKQNYHNYQIKDVKALKQISTVVIPTPRPTRPQVNGRDWRSQHLLRHHTPTHRQRTPYSQRYHPPTLHKASPPPYRHKTMSTSQSTRVHKKSPHTSKYKIKRPPGRPKHGVLERKRLRGPPPVVHDGSPAWRSKIDSREDDVVDTRDEVEEDPRAGPSSLALKEAQSLLTKEARDTNKARRRVGGLAKAKAQVWNRRIDLERQKEDERYSMEAERLVKRAKHCKEGNDEEQVRRVKELLEMTDDIKNLEKRRDREEEQIRYVQMLAIRELQRRQVIESRMNWM